MGEPGRCRRGALHCVRFVRAVGQVAKGWTSARIVATLLAATAAAGHAQAGAQADEPPSRGLRYASVGNDAGIDTLAPPLPREFRAVWVATVSNIDWPSRPGLSTVAQQRELIAILDRAAALRLNAVIFQVRPAGDALYSSKLEPWSYFLTGSQGRGPQPSYDPLAFAIAEAHQRGLELHAWFNPYRAKHPDDTSRIASPLHISRTHPHLVHKYGAYLWMDPGEPEVRRKTLDVVLDVVRRYDVDGVHIDDYFYPYPERARRGGLIPFPDDRSWRAYKANEGTLSRNDWRRRNVDLLVEQLYTEIKAAKPWVKFGVSPFGIWRPGNPASVRGFDAYESLFADSKKWLNEGWLDYWTPQLYWRTTAPAQRYADLLTWWRGQNLKGRHIWPGNYTSRASARRRSTWPVGEIMDQIQETRAQLSPSSGNVHFSMDAFLVNRDSLNERLADGLYHEPALVPPSPWLAIGVPDAPIVVRVPRPRVVELDVTRMGAPLVDAPPPGARPSAATPRGRLPPDKTSAPANAEVVRSIRDPHWWLVRARYVDGWYARVVPATERTIRLPLEATDASPTVIYVSAVDHAGQESPSAVVR
ncbi:MAG: family 10 glycosylhydrolase [Gemmatimonadaceae bacterium]|nr:family 10 glycosylhydrolase [Gemmatimonadaceae bacterium]